MGGFMGFYDQRLHLDADVFKINGMASRIEILKCHAVRNQTNEAGWCATHSPRYRGSWSTASSEIEYVREL
jgi:hypothetical protein